MELETGVINAVFPIVYQDIQPAPSIFRLARKVTGRLDMIERVIPLKGSCIELQYNIDQTAGSHACHD